ncbi:hypothetical protein WMY93_031777, partial [Mugilogobius chulae]
SRKSYGLIKDFIERKRLKRTCSPPGPQPSPLSVTASCATASLNPESRSIKATLVGLAA